MLNTIEMVYFIWCKWTRTHKNTPNTWIQALNDEFNQSIDNEILKCIFFLPRLPLAFEKINNCEKKHLYLCYQVCTEWSDHLFAKMIIGENITVGRSGKETNMKNNYALKVIFSEKTILILWCLFDFCCGKEWKGKWS